MNLGQLMTENGLPCLDLLEATPGLLRALMIELFSPSALKLEDLAAMDAIVWGATPVVSDGVQQFRSPTGPRREFHGRLATVSFASSLSDRPLVVPTATGGER